MNLHPIFLTAGLPPAALQMLMIVLLIVIFYFFIIRPQSKKQKQLQKTREALRPGDKIITAGGIYGIIREINPTTRIVTVEVWDGVKIKVDFNSIYSVNETSSTQK